MPGHSSMWEGNRCHWVSTFWKPGTFRHNSRVRELLIPILKMRKPSFAEAVSAHDHVVGGGRARLQPRAPIPRLRALIAIPREAPTAQTWATGHLSARHSVPLTHTSAHPCTHTYTRSLPLAYSHTLFLPSPARQKKQRGNKSVFEMCPGWQVCLPLASRFVGWDWWLYVLSPVPPQLRFDDRLPALPPSPGAAVSVCIPAFPAASSPSSCSPTSTPALLFSLIAAGESSL